MENVSESVTRDKNHHVIVTDISDLRLTKSASSVRVSILAVDLAAFVVFDLRCFTADAFSLLDFCNGELIVRPLSMNDLLLIRILFALQFIVFLNRFFLSNPIENQVFICLICL